MTDWMKKIKTRIEDNYELMYPFSLIDSNRVMDTSDEKRLLV
jgi:hypothetical protein